MNTDYFIKRFSDIAVSKYKETKILPSLVIAQAILESGYGTSELALNACNYFGLNHYNDSVTSKYPIYTMLAPQQSTNGWVYNKENFCKFNSIEECCECLFNWYNRDKYKELHGIRDYQQACKFVQDKGYATDSSYSVKLINIILKHRLYEYDDIVLSEKGYYVQIGYFENYEYAVKQRDKAIELGFTDCWIKEGDKI